MVIRSPLVIRPLSPYGYPLLSALYHPMVIRYCPLSSYVYPLLSALLSPYGYPLLFAITRYGYPLLPANTLWLSVIVR